MTNNDFKLIEISPQQAQKFRPDLPLLDNFVLQPEFLNEFSHQVKNNIENLDLTEVNFLAQTNTETQFKTNLPITVYLTYGIDPLYDSWVVSNQTESFIFLNADGFKYSFNSTDALILIHELVHIIIKNKLPVIDSNDFLGQYHRIMIDEGLAHFISFPYREKLLSSPLNFADKKIATQKIFFKSQRLLISKTSDKEKKKILLQANTGSYWDKHASIFGLFLFSDIYKHGGLPACLDKLNSFANSPNLNTIFSDDLYDYPEIPSSIKNHIEIENQRIQNCTGDDKFKKLSRLAVCYRQIFEFTKAHELFKTVSEHFENKNPTMQLVNFIRWSDVFRFEKKFDDCLFVLDKANQILMHTSTCDLNSTNDLKFEYKDFYIQHLGKLYFDRGQYPQAMNCFKQALELRLKKSNPELIASTEWAIHFTQLKLDLINSSN